MELIRIAAKLVVTPFLEDRLTSITLQVIDKFPCESRIGAALCDRDRCCSARSILPVDLNNFSLLWQPVRPRAESNPSVQRGVVSPGVDGGSAARTRLQGKKFHISSVALNILFYPLKPGLFSLPVRSRKSAFGIFIRLDGRQKRASALMRW